MIRWLYPLLIVLLVSVAVVVRLPAWISADPPAMAPCCCQQAPIGRNPKRYDDGRRAPRQAVVTQRGQCKGVGTHCRCGPPCNCQVCPDQCPLAQ